ncbi:MAG: hypothetical protein LBF72_01940 [Holosporales bacterium]|nr:hypothetical protein [Holosporales bacterium]
MSTGSESLCQRIPSHRKFASRRHAAQKYRVLMVREHSSNVGLPAKSQTLSGRRLDKLTTFR